MDLELGTSSACTVISPLELFDFTLQQDSLNHAALNSRGWVLVVITMRGVKTQKLDRDDSVLDGVLYQVGIGFEL